MFSFNSLPPPNTQFYHYFVFNYRLWYNLINLEQVYLCAADFQPVSLLHLSFSHPPSLHPDLPPLPLAFSLSHTHTHACTSIYTHMWIKHHFVRTPQKVLLQHLVFNSDIIFTYNISWRSTKPQTMISSDPITMKLPESILHCCNFRVFSSTIHTHKGRTS